MRSLRVSAAMACIVGSLCLPAHASTPKLRSISIAYLATTSLAAGNVTFFAISSSTPVLWDTDLGHVEVYSRASEHHAHVATRDADGRPVSMWVQISDAHGVAYSYDQCDATSFNLPRLQSPASITFSPLIGECTDSSSADKGYVSTPTVGEITVEFSR